MFLANLRFYFGFYRPHAPRVALSMVLFAIKHGVWMVFPLIVKFIIDDFIPAGRIDLILWCIPLVLFLGLVNLSAHVPYVVLTINIIKSVSLELRSRIIHRLQMLSLSFLTRAETGRHYSKIMLDVTKCEHFANTLFRQLMGALGTFAYAFLFMAVTNVKLLGVYMLTFPVYIVFFRIFRSRFTRYQNRARLADEDFSQSVNHFIQTSTLSRIHGEEDFEHKKVREKGWQIIREYKNITRSIGVFQILVGASNQLFQIVIIGFCAAAVIAGRMTIGELVLFYQYMQQMVSSIQGLMDLFPVFTEFNESVRSIREIVDCSDVESNDKKKTLPSLKGRIEFQNVSYSYEKGRHALRGVHLTIEPGSTIALVGPSGAGKSTFINMVLGLLRAQEGRVLLDDDDINDLDMRQVRRSVGVVTQDPILFHGSIADNIAHARPSTSMEQLEEAARIANAHEFIVRMPEGYDSLIGERGVTLSGGQKQRIAIARAIYRKPGLLIFDEATSALDSMSEQEVQQGIKAVLGKQTTITIAHRLSTVVHADCILVFQDGSIVEQGRHGELLKQDGVYAKLFWSQNAHMRLSPSESLNVEN